MLKPLILEHDLLPAILDIVVVLGVERDQVHWANIHTAHGTSISK